MVVYLTEGSIERSDSSFLSFSNSKYFSSKISSFLLFFGLGTGSLNGLYCIIVLVLVLCQLGSFDTFVLHLPLQTLLIKALIVNKLSTTMTSSSSFLHKNPREIFKNEQF